MLVLTRRLCGPNPPCVGLRRRHKVATKRTNPHAARAVRNARHHALQQRGGVLRAGVPAHAAARPHARKHQVFVCLSVGHQGRGGARTTRTSPATSISIVTLSARVLGGRGGTKKGVEEGGDLRGARRAPRTHWNSRCTRPKGAFPGTPPRPPPR